jgi:hypothetical protein
LWPDRSSSSLASLEFTGFVLNKAGIRMTQVADNSRKRMIKMAEQRNSGRCGNTAKNTDLSVWNNEDR